jgi:Na+/melibiose symporter-like transporter
VFWTLVLLCLLAFCAAYIAVADSRESAAPRHIDWPGAGLVITGVALLSITVDRGDSWGWGSAKTIGAFVLAGALLVSFVLLEARVRMPLVDLKLFRNLPYVLVTGMGAVANIVYVVTVFVVTLYLQEVRGLSPLTAGAVFLAPSLMVAMSGPLGSRLGKLFRPAAVMAAAGVVAGVGLLAMTFTHGWPAYVLCFAFAGIGLGLGWTFASIATEDLVSPERAGEASGVLLTILVTAGGIGLATTATVLELVERSGTSANDAITGTLRVLAAGIIVAAVVMMTLRRRLVRRGLMPPLSMRAPWTPPR